MFRSYNVFPSLKTTLKTEMVPHRAIVPAVAAETPKDLTLGT
jgi:hypothetical protein